MRMKVTTKTDMADVIKKPWPENKTFVNVWIKTKEGLKNG